MAVTISQYIDAVANPNGRFRTLAGIYPSLDQSGEPVMKVNDLCADFEVVSGGEKYTLKCLLGTSAKTRECLREISTFVRLIDTPYLTPCSYLEDEILVFDMMGEPRQLDVLLTKIPSGVPLGSFFEKCAQHMDGAAIGRLAAGVCEMARWMWDNELSAGRISLHNIYVGSDNTPIIADYTNARRKRSVDELRGWCSLVAALCCCAAESGLYERFFKEHIAGKSKLIAMSGMLESALSGLGSSPLKELVSLIDTPSQDEAVYPERLLDLAAELASQGAVDEETLQSISKLASLPGGKTGGNIPAPSAKYLFIGDMNCNKMRAFDGKHWYYIDKNGEVLISGELLDASDFEEGRAVVETDSGFGMIDEDGQFVIEPWFDDVSWDSYHNIAIATRDGASGIFSRSGEKLTELEYDHILDCSEGLLAARKGDRFGYLHRDGTTAIDFTYEDAFGFRDGIARVKCKGRDILIDSEGCEVDMIIG